MSVSLILGSFTICKYGLVFPYSDDPFHIHDV